MSVVENSAQAIVSENEFVVPALRSDLQISEAPDSSEGSPVWMIFDPLTSRFKNVSWAQMEVLGRMRRAQPFAKLYESLQHYTAIDLTKEELSEFIKDIAARNLLSSSLHKPVASLLAEKKRSKVNPLVWLFHHYLYFRIPLIHPDRFLDVTYKYVRILTSGIFILFYLVLTITGIYFLSTRFDEYLHTFPRFYGFSGVIIYGLGISCVKVIHEFSHAYVAKSKGVRVPTMGIAVIFLLPVPFCDVTDGWKMKNRRKRLQISAAGVCAELTIAGLSLFFWGISASGIWQSLFFVLSSVSIVGTLFINLNPCMRYDGYFLISDLFKIDNLQQRATLTTKWFYRKTLFGLKYKCPEEDLTLKRLCLMSAYSVSAWIYRLFLYTSIAVMVYYAFDFKLLGIILFLLEIVYFLIMPVIKEIIVVIKNISICIKSWRFLLLLAGFAAVVFWLCIPSSHTEKIPGIIIPEQSQTVYVSHPGVVTELNISKGEAVSKGELLFVTEFAELDSSIKLSELEIARTAEEIQLVSEDSSGKSLLPQKIQTLQQNNAELVKLKRIRQQMKSRAQIDGTVYSFDEAIKPGVYVYSQQEIARIADTARIKVIGYLPEYKLNSVNVEVDASFILDGNNKVFALEIIRINKVKAEFLKYPALASILGGDIAVASDKSGNLEMVDTYYEIEAILTDRPADSNDYCFDQTGYIWFNTESYSLLEYYYKKIRAVLSREVSL